ncbi:phage tail assembly chaperone [Microvirga sp. 2MCAF38]|uniref:phage tail assembly chaperone n=1 Tax=Microvirga sp. 2MCAF38 TaxID=3232989 RepID=UPI003F9AF1A6
MSAAEAFPWDDALSFGLGVLRWNPDTFWHATPRELIAAWETLNGVHKSQPATSRDLRRMMEAFPDDDPAFLTQGA